MTNEKQHQTDACDSRHDLAAYLRIDRFYK